MRPDALFAMPSWLAGAARSLDVAGQFDEYNDSLSGQEADARALFSDWRTVGESIVDAVIGFRRESQAQATEDPRG